MDGTGSHVTLRIRGIRREDSEEVSRLVFSIDKTIVENNGSTTVNSETFLEAPTEYAPFLVTERADAIVALLIGYASGKGCEIQSDVPVSEDFYHNVIEILLPELNDGITLSSELLPPLPKGNSVGSGMQCDVDSMHAAMKYSDYKIQRFKLTHLCTSNLDYLGDDYSLTDDTECFLSRAREVAGEIGLPMISVRTNACEEFPIGSQDARVYAEAFIALCLRKLWRCYFIPCSEESIGFAPFLMSCLSSPGLELIPEGLRMSRYGKIAGISDFAPAQRHLLSCQSGGGNCGICDGCAFDMLALDSLGKLDLFSETYDIEFYGAHRERYLRQLAHERDDPRYVPICASFLYKGDAQYVSADESESLIRNFDALWAKNDPESDAEAVASIMPLASGDIRAAYRLADAYASGRGVKKNREKELGCLRSIAETYRMEMVDGFPSGCDLFDVLWRSGESDSDLLDSVRPTAEAGDSSACVRMSKAFAEGRGTKKDPDGAIFWMGKAFEADPPEYAEDYCEMLISSQDPEKQAEAARLCESQAASLRNPKMCAMMSGLFRDGKGVEKNLSEACGWMAKAAEMDRSYELEWCRMTLEHGDSRAKAKAAEVCLRGCEELQNPDYWTLMSEIYRDGIGVRKDIGEAIRWMREAVAVRPSRLSYEFFRLLQSSDDENNRREAFEGATERFEKTGSTMYLALIARAYRDGKGTEKDLAKAVELMRKASKESPSKYLREYCEILVDSDDPKDNKEALRRCESLYSKTGSAFSCKLLARMYRDGKGVEKDLDKAFEWIGRYREAEGSDELGYCEFLLSTGMESACSEAWEICNERYSETADPKCCGLIARMYRDGKGVGKDRDKAIEWMEKAFLDDPAVWEAEFNELLG